MRRYAVVDRRELQILEWLCYIVEAIVESCTREAAYTLDDLHAFLQKQQFDDPEYAELVCGTVARTLRAPGDVDWARGAGVTLSGLCRRLWVRLLPDLPTDESGESKP